MRKIINETIENYKRYLVEEEKSRATIDKYIHDITVFCSWIDGQDVDKQIVLKYKEMIVSNYAPRSVNSMLSSLNSFFDYIGWHDCKVKTLKIQKQIFTDKDKELTKAEYERLLKAAKEKNNKRLSLLMQTICSTGIRVSEDIYCKG